MDNGIFFTNNRNNIMNENLNYSDHIDGIDTYSFQTFDSLKEYIKINNLVEYVNNDCNLNKSDDSSRCINLNKVGNNYFKSLRSSLKSSRSQYDFKHLQSKSMQQIKPQVSTSSKSYLEKKEGQNKASSELEKNQINYIDNSSKLFSVIWQPTLNHSNVDEKSNGSSGNNFSDNSSINTESNSVCGKEHCRFGCICEAILTTATVRRDHCGKYECMFECLCNGQMKLNEADLDENESSSTDGQSNSANYMHNANKNYMTNNTVKTRRSKRQKYLSLKAYEILESDSLNTSGKRNRLDAFKQALVSSTKRARINNNDDNDVFTEQTNRDSINNSRIYDCDISHNTNMSMNFPISIKKISKLSKKGSLTDRDDEKYERKIKKFNVNTLDKSKVRRESYNLKHEATKKNNTNQENLRKMRNNKKLIRMRRRLTNENHSKLYTGIHKIRSKFLNRINDSLKYQRKEPFKSHIRSVILKIERNQENGNSNYKIKTTHTIPLYIESMIEWSLKSEKIFQIISKILMEFPNYDWSQIGFDCGELTVVLFSPLEFSFHDKTKNSSSFMGKKMTNIIEAPKYHNEAFNTNNKQFFLKKENLSYSKPTPICVKIFKLDESEKVSLSKKIMNKHNFTPVDDNNFSHNNTSYDKLINNQRFIVYNKPKNYSINKINNFGTKVLSDDASKCSASDLNDKCNSKCEVQKPQLPRLICRKRSLNRNSKQTGMLQVDNLNVLTETLNRYRSFERPYNYYDPFSDIYLITSLYKLYGRYFVDEVCDIVNYMVISVDDHLTKNEKRRLEDEEKNREFLTYMQKISNKKNSLKSALSYNSLLDVTLVKDLSTFSTNKGENENSYSTIIDSNKSREITFKSKSFNTNNVVNKNNLNLRNISLTPTVSNNKRITPILPKASQCYKVISTSSPIGLSTKASSNYLLPAVKSNEIINNVEDKANVNNNDTSNNVTNILTKPSLDKSINLYPSAKLVKKIDSISMSTNIYNDTSRQTQSQNNLKLLYPKIISSFSRDNSKQCKTFIKVVSFNQNDPNYINNSLNAACISQNKNNSNVKNVIYNKDNNANMNDTLVNSKFNSTNIEKNDVQAKMNSDINILNREKSGNLIKIFPKNIDPRLNSSKTASIVSASRIMLKNNINTQSDLLDSNDVSFTKVINLNTKSANQNDSIAKINNELIVRSNDIVNNNQILNNCLNAVNKVFVKAVSNTSRKFNNIIITPITKNQNPISIDYSKNIQERLEKNFDAGNYNDNYLNSSTLKNVSDNSNKMNFTYIDNNTESNKNIRIDSKCISKATNDSQSSEFNNKADLSGLGEFRNFDTYNLDSNANSQSVNTKSEKNELDVELKEEFKTHRKEDNGFLKVEEQLNDDAITMRRRKRKQDFTLLLRKNVHKYQSE